MLERTAYNQVKEALQRQAAVVLLGPRQVGKTTLARRVGDATASALYLDLENPVDAALLAHDNYLRTHADKLIILDEIHRAPGLFPVLRGLIDEGRRTGRRTNRFLLLGSASMDLMQQSGESLAGRVAYIEMTPLTLREVSGSDLDRLWLRGGFPDSYLADSDADSQAWRSDMVRTYLERDMPDLGPRVPAETMRRLWTMLAHNHGQLANLSQIASSLEISNTSIHRYCDMLVDLLLVRRLSPYHVNTGKRLRKTPKWYLRDTGILHQLLGVPSLEDLYRHPVYGPSWEGFVIENILATAPPDCVPGYYRTSAGTEVDLVLELRGGERWAIEVKRSATAHLGNGFYHACEDIKAARCLIVHPDGQRFHAKHKAEYIGLAELLHQLAHLS